MNPYELTPDEARDYIKGSEAWPLRDTVCRLIGDRTVLEVGCANGIQAARFTAEKYTGMDWSPSLLTEARIRLPDHRFIEGDATMIPFADDTFEAAYAISVLEHLPSVESVRKCIAEMHRVAGRVIIGWHTPPTDEPTDIRWVNGHFGRECWSNRYCIADLIELDRVIIHIVPGVTDKSLVWEIL